MSSTSSTPSTPVAQNSLNDPRRPSLVSDVSIAKHDSVAGSLPSELLEAIFSNLDSPADIFRCLQVSRRWFLSAAAALWKHLEIYTDEWDLFRALLSTSSKNHRSLIGTASMISLTGSGGASPMQQHTPLGSPRRTPALLDMAPSPSLLSSRSSSQSSSIDPPNLVLAHAAPLPSPVIKDGNTSVSIPGTPSVSASDTLSTVAPLPLPSPLMVGSSSFTSHTPLLSTTQLLTPRRTKSLIDYRSLVLKLRLIASSSGWASGTLRLLGLRKILPHCTRLTVLELDCPALNDDDLWVVSKSCSNLKSISLVSAPFESGMITDEGLIAIATYCTFLQHIKLKAQHDSGFTDRGISKLTEVYGGRLLTFAIEWIGLYSSTRGMLVSGLTSENTSPVTGLAVSGESVPLTPGLSDRATMEKRFGDALIELIAANPQLELFSLDWPVSLEPILKAAAEHLHCLRRLRIGNAYVPDTIAAVIESNPKLESLSLFELNTTSDPSVVLEPLLRRQGVSAPTLTTDIVDTNAFSSASLSVSTAPSVLPPTEDLPPNTVVLTELELDGVGFMRTLLPIVSRFTSLTHLKLTAFRRVASLHNSGTDESLSHLIRACPNLVLLHVPIVGDLPIQQLASSCPNLRDLDIVDGHDLTDYAFLLLARRCTGLSTLYLGSATHLTDNAIVILARSSATNMKKITLPYMNRNITTRSIEALAEHCPRLEGLANVPGTIHPNELGRYVQRMGRLLILGVCLTSAAAGVEGPAWRDEYEKLKSGSRRLKQIVYNM
ncbi:hypothetical protein BJ742DRAFT_781854 [Cladochytrium replicatum]|nr:hypothetical protein BJ742DRAFT_781854 [Cladochytrium replicatum]